LTWDVRNQIRKRVEEELGVLHKHSPIRVALCYPAPYRVAMSSLGFQSIYREIHQHPECAAERAFLPDDPGKYRRNNIRVLTYEGEKPLSSFPVVAFSIAFELELPGIFEMLDLSGIPLLRQERSQNHPLIIAGGALTNSNPVILAPFVDLIILGEGEQLIHLFLDEIASESKEKLLYRLSKVKGCYVPGLTPDLSSGAKADDDRLPAYSQIITKETVLTSMFLIEPERGCSRGCTYCVMRRAAKGGMRLVPPERVLSLIPEEAQRVGLVGAAVTDHPEIKEIVSNIVSSGREIGVSSLRADRLDHELVQLLAKGGYKTLTIASDGISQRIRNLVNRATTEKHLICAAEMARSARLRHLKLYEMLGLPGETMDDVDELIRFSVELSKIAPLSLSISPFVAKKNTPLNGAPFEPIASLAAKLRSIRSRLKGKVDVRPSSARWAWVEYILSQAGESAGLAAMDAWREGGSFSAWRQAVASRDVITCTYRPVLGGCETGQDSL
jgi:radical SAM superfamily enzyme YgiQ (UPF0313 family)